MSIDRRNATVNMAHKLDIFQDAKLPWFKLNALYTIVCQDNEDWDGEEVSPEHICKLMVSHYTRFGVKSSIP